MAEATLDQTQEIMPVAAQADQDLGIQTPSELTDQLPEPVDNRTGLSKIVTDFFDQPVVKQALPAIILVTVIAICFLFYLYMTAPTYRALNPGMSEADRQAAVTALEGTNISFRIDTRTGELTVPDNEYHEARMFLAGQNIPRSSNLGSLDALLEQGSMTTSRFMEQVSYRAAMEKELGKSVSEIGTIKTARVHLAEPQQSVFVRNQTPAKASVVVVPYPGRVVTRNQIQAIVHLVSSSIPYLPAENVTVVDNTGNLLTSTEGEAAMTLTSAQTQHKSSVERGYQSRIEQILGPIVGLGNVRSEVDVTVNFTEVETTSEAFDRTGSGPKTRSESLDFERDGSIEASGLPGSFSNAPPDDPSFVADPSLGTAEASQRSTNSASSAIRNYELDREIRYTKQQVGQIERLSVAVVINELALGVVAEPEEGEEAKTEVSPEQIERLTDVVKGAVGFNEARGDIVTVLPTSFARPVETIEDIAWYRDSDILDLIKYGAGIVMILGVLLFVVRPLLMPAQEDEPLEIPRELKDGELSDSDMVDLSAGEDLEAIRAKLVPKKSSIPLEMLDQSQSYDDKVAVLRMIVAEEPAKVAGLFRKMITPDNNM